MLTFFLQVIHQTSLRLLTEDADVFSSFSDGEVELLMLEDLAVVHSLGWFVLHLWAVVLLNILSVFLSCFDNLTKLEPLLTFITDDLGSFNLSYI